MSVKTEEAARSNVSVVVPLYNYPDYIFRALASVYWQLGPDDDIIVVDDCSTRKADMTRLKPFLDRVIWLDNPVNRGLPFTRNRAILESRAEWIKFLDADDVLCPFTLNAVRNREQPIAPAIQLLSGGCHRVINHEYSDYLNGADESMYYLARINPMLPSATFVRRRALLTVGLFDERIDFEEDWDMWFRLAEQYGADAFQKLDQPFCYYWIEDNERAKKRRSATIGNLTVRDYFRDKYGADPEPYWRPSADSPPL